MSTRFASTSQCAFFLMLGAAAGCGSSEPRAESTGTVQGALDVARYTGVVVPSILAQDTAGHTFSTRVNADGTFAMQIPAGHTYRFFVTDLRASGRLSLESRILIAGSLAWVTVGGSGAAGTTSDGTPLNLGTVSPIASKGGLTADGAVSAATSAGGGVATVGGSAGGAGGGTGVAGSAGGGTTDGTGTSGTGGAVTSGNSGANGSGGGGGSSGGGAAGGTTTDGPSACAPPQVGVSSCSGHDGSASGSAPSNEGSLVPPCTAPDGGAGGSGGGGGGASSSGGATSSTTPPGAPQCESDKQAVFKEGRWDCVKMETPVTYFYSDKPIRVRASVEFPNGVLTQWYPSVVDSYPLVADKHLVPVAESKAKTCTSVLGSIGASNGLLDWGTLDVLPPGSNVDALLPAASLDRYTWSFAREVAANPVRVSNGQLEKFLFYRGVGNFSLPVRVTSQPGGRLVLTNLIKEDVGTVFFLNVTPDRGTFTSAKSGIASGATLNGAIPALGGAPDVETYATALAKSVRTALDENGLFDDEATAMVNTWKRQWFRTPGARLLYIAPQAWTDRSIPLAIDPTPESTKRVMVIRVEIVTPELEAADAGALKKLADPATAAQARNHFAALGRFAEPRLRRAMALLGSPAWTAPLLAEVVETNHRTHTPTAGSLPLAADRNGPRYAGKGFVVHEWGTDTIVVGSDGSQLLGLQHEEEDLPRFVYDRRH